MATGRSSGCCRGGGRILSLLSLVASAGSDEYGEVKSIAAGSECCLMAASFAMTNGPRTIARLGRLQRARLRPK